MTHCMTQAEKRKILEDIRELALSEILQQEDMVEIEKIIQRAVCRMLAAIDDPYPVDVQNGADSND